MEDLLSRFRTYADPREGLDGNPFRLRCSVGLPATPDEISSAWPDRGLPPELTQFWSNARECRLFEDVDYGQWGLAILSPESSARRTADEQARRPGDFHREDIVVGEFLGDQDLLILAPSDISLCQVLVELPLDHRLDWPKVADGLAEFLELYLESYGAKFWERID